MSGVNIVSLDVPYPPDYGGVADIFYKIVALHALGVKVHLHCFEYGRGQPAALERYCEVVHYYHRETGLWSNVSTLPYITRSRRSERLLERLKSNDHPVLLEGLHSVYYLLRGKLRGRVVSLRSHNIEHDYYGYLARRESNLIKKVFFYKEAYLLRGLLHRLPVGITVGAIAPTDVAYLEGRFAHTFWLPPFHSNDTVTSLEGRGDYALYHGNLSVSENTEVVKELIAQFRGKDIVLTVAGKNPSTELLSEGRPDENIRIVPNPTARQMGDLISHAHVILLPTRQPTGIKLKLIESLYRGRFCVANRAMVENTHLEASVVMEETNFYTATRQLMPQAFTTKDISARRSVLSSYYDNQANAELLTRKLALAEPIR